MPLFLRSHFLAPALFVPAAMTMASIALHPALAQSDGEFRSSVSFRALYDRLAPYGHRFESDQMRYRGGGSMGEAWDGGGSPSH
jgi:hypothetical protein